MRPFGIVVMEIVGDCFVPCREGVGDAPQTIPLKSLNEPFHVAIVGRRPHARVAMGETLILNNLGEPF